MDILRTIGLPLGQQNDRSALTLLALVDLKPGSVWSDARLRMIGVTPIMEFVEREYAKEYAPNSRETIRRFTLHQFLQAGIVKMNPDDPERPTNSPGNVYQIEEVALRLFQTYGTPQWKKELEHYLSEIETLQTRYARAREMGRIPLQLPNGTRISLSRGGQNELVQQIIEEFCPRFTPGAQAVYVGDTGKKWAYFDSKVLTELGVTIEEHGKIPDVVVYLPQQNWIVLIEAVTSHGPVNPKRYEELKSLFSDCSAGLVFVTAFPNTKTFTRYATEIAWETEVWIAEHPTHLIHYNGSRFLGPYAD